ncbi:hypothetical protein RRG08_063183 [Elysia crispata]|uniref:Reverse transcriptase domain-containing protein n=1 Tax=Elysia crispata TaxID=231223 RepID=A0AAE1D4E7_9GAST|nr:hypothetical protein RRG08_063183 [Elysia crispata]
MINNHAIKFVVDTGASVNVITNTAYKALSPRPKLSPSSTSVYSYNTKEKLPILGCFSSRVRYKERTIEAQFYVVEGLRRFKRLMFGVNAAPEIFPHAMSDILHDIPGVTHFIDDIIVHGKDRAAHDASLTETLKRLTQRGVKLNKEKCLFGVNKLSFLGHTFGDRGISPEAQKIKAITSAKAPTSISELRSFLGMTQFVSRYIAHMHQSRSP